MVEVVPIFSSVEHPRILGRYLGTALFLLLNNGGKAGQEFSVEFVCWFGP